MLTFWVIFGTLGLRRLENAQESLETIFVFKGVLMCFKRLQVILFFFLLIFVDF
jgi:hypothetical protein